MPGSKLFQRNRALGHVCNQLSAVIRFAKNRFDNVIVTSVGRTFHVYSSNHFRLICVSGLHPQDITALASDAKFVYTASGTKIYAWRGGNVARHTFDGHLSKVHTLLPFGNAHLISIDANSLLKVWNVLEADEVAEISFSNDEFHITTICHPPTYLNKILLGSRQGRLQLWNIKECKLVYTFQQFNEKINVIEVAPAIDVVAIGFANGDIVLLNLKFDKILMQFKQDWGPVTTISFRTDGQPLMATGSSNGHVVIWNLEERNIHSQFIAHSASLASTVYLPNEPLLFTSSSDNSIKLWIFDSIDGAERLLRIREGHAAPPICIKYHGTDGKVILSSSEDSSLRAISLISETLNKSLGKASYNRKASKKRHRLEEDPLLMPPIVEFTSGSIREKEWDNIAAIHSGLIMVTTWSFHRSKMGELKLVPEQFQNKNRKDFNAEATCISITHCGNFVIIGYSSGDVERFNIQSGIHRQHYGEKHAHKIAVRGVYSDNLNQMVISGDSDGVIKFWLFAGHTNQHLEKITMAEGVSFFRGHSESGMLGIALDDYTIIVMDCETKTIIRKFVGHTARLTDATFSPDSRWLITASMDGSIKVWDIPSSCMIDHFCFESPCISLTMSPTGDFLATAHVNNLGIFTFGNKSLFAHIPLKSIEPTSEPFLIDLPSWNYKTEPIDENAEGIDADAEYKSPDQIDEQLITMSTIAASRWQNLLSLDTVKKRNRPKNLIVKPKHASFFLPTVAGLDFQFDLTADTKDDGNETKSKIIHAEKFSNLTTFGRILDQSVKTTKFDNCVNHIKNLGPSMTDFEIKSLSPDGGGNVIVMEQFMKMIIFMFNSNVNFELAQSYLSVFLREHGRLILDNAELRQHLKTIEMVQNKSWSQLEKKLIYSIAVSSESRLYAS